MTQEQLNEFAAKVEGRPGVSVTRDFFGNVTEVSYSTPPPIEIDFYLERPEWPQTGTPNRRTS